MRHARIALAAFAAALLVSGAAAAQTKKPGKGAPAAPADPALADAKTLFKQGIEIFNTGDYERALDFFLRSRAAFPSAVNTTNAAICLDKLKRYDEALEMYEEVITKHSSQIDESERKALAPSMASLRAKVGSVDVSANVEGTVVIDGRPRGKLPLTTPLRAMPGTRTVRVMKNGYLSKEAQVTVKVGQTSKVDLSLEPLASSGLVRVEDPARSGFEVFVDRVSVGTVPWEGTLAPGKHVVWEKKGDLGSAPASVQVVQAQTALVRLSASKLGAPTRVELASESAEIAIDGVSLGPGSWEGRLPEGQHTIVVSEAGYREKSQTVLSSSGATTTTLRVALEIDPNHPRWPRRGNFWVGVFGGYGFAPSLGSGAEEKCTGAACASKGLAGGALAGARFGYRWSFGLSVELGAAFAYLTRPLSRTINTKFGTAETPITYTIDDKLRVVGPLVVGSVSYRLAIGSTFGLLGRFGAGALFGAASDVMEGKAKAGGQTVKLNVEGFGQVSRGAAAIMMPELGVDLAFGSWHVGAGAVAMVILTDGPDVPIGAISPTGTCPKTTNPAAAACAGGSNVVAHERGYGQSISVTPALSVGYQF